MSTSPNYFPANEQCPTFAPAMAQKLVGYGCKRVKRSGIATYEGVRQPQFLAHSDLELGDCIGQGSFSSVFDVVSIRSESDKTVESDKVVVKVLRKKLMANPRMFAACAGDLFKEGLILASLSHKNIVSAQAFAHGGIAAYKSGRHDAFFIVLEKLDDTLSDRLKDWQTQKKRLPFFPSSKKTLKKSALLQSKSDIILQLATAVEYIHSVGMIHRDLKPDNIGFTADGVLKVFDFDVARILPTTRVPDETFKLTKKVGSPRYMSPECALGEEYNEKTDVYAFALLFHEIFTLQKPFADLPSEVHEKAVFMGGDRPLISDSWTSEMKSLVEQCWSSKLSARPSMTEARLILEKEFPRFVEHKGKSKKSWSKGRAQTLPQ